MKPTEESFLKDVAGHKMTVLRDDGIYRHLHFAIPGSGHMHFDLVTYPNFLCYSGDMGCYVFSRINDMFEFFRGKEAGPLRINERYWAEKLEATSKTDGHYQSWRTTRRAGCRRSNRGSAGRHNGIRADHRQYAPDKFEAHVNEWLDEVQADQDLRDRAKDEILNFSPDGELPARQALTDFEHGGRRPFEDSWECDFSEYTHRFLWCCCAIVWGIRQYDLAKPTEVKTEKIADGQ
jgi:hypothetical protein